MGDGVPCYGALEIVGLLLLLLLRRPLTRQKKWKRRQFLRAATDCGASSLTSLIISVAMRTRLILSFFMADNFSFCSRANTTKFHAVRLS